MQFVRWLASMISGVWHILDFDPFNFGINLNMLLLGITVFAFMISFFKRIGGIESGGFNALGNLSRSEMKNSKGK